MESSSTTGTGAYTLAGAVTGFQSFAIVGNANTVQYSAWEVDVLGNPSGGWENGLGTYTASGTTLARTTIYTSSNSNSAVNWSAGTRYIACSPLTEGTLVVRQPGGTVGDDELWLYDDGTNSFIEGKNVGNDMKFMLPFGRSFDFLGNGGHSIIVAGLRDSGSFNFNITGTHIGLKRSTMQIGFGSNGITEDVAFISPTAGVFTVSDGSTGTGWIQNSAGEAALESAFTRSDATLTSTNLSLTVIAGRSYRITGYLIVSNSVAAEGAKFDFDGGTATRTTFDVTFNAVGGTVVPGTISATALDTDLNYTSVTGTTRIFVQGYLEVNAGGTLILRASEDSTATGTMTLAAGSWLALYDTVDK